MPRSSEEAVGKVLDFIRGHPDGVTSGDVATSLGVPERTARRYLSKLHERGDVSRAVEYSGEPVTFHYRYTAKGKKPKPKPT